MSADDRARAIERANAGNVEIHCRRCDALLATRYVDGSVEPLVPGARLLPDGRLWLRCPRHGCGLARRVRAGWRDAA